MKTKIEYLQEGIINIREVYGVDVPDAKDMNEQNLVELCEIGVLEVIETGNTMKLNIYTGLLEQWLIANFTSFKETEGVYKWCKPVCDNRIEAINRWRAHGYGTFENWYNEVSRNRR